MALTQDEEIRSPDWWLLRLGRRLRERRKTLKIYRDYYRGEHPLPQAPSGAIEAFHQFQRKSRTNFCRTIPRATASRSIALGITDADGEPDKQAWRWWQRNGMDAKHRPLVRGVAGSAWGYLMVGPHPRDARRPLMTVEDPREVIVERDPATGEVIVGLKAWWDSIDRVCRATLYLPEGLVRYVTGTTPSPRELPWGRTSWTLVDQQVGALDEVSIAEFEFLADTGEEPEPDFWPARDAQDRLNLAVFSRMSSERYAGFPQKWSTGTKLEKKIDPLTGLEIPVNPFVPGPNNTWVSEQAEAKFGQLAPVDISGLLKGHEFDIRTMLVQTATPAYAFPAELVNVSTDTVMALDEGHVAKCLELHTAMSEEIERAFGWCSQIAGEARDFSEHEMIWANPRLVNPAVLADMAVKLRTAGWPVAMIAEDMGYSPQRVTRLRTESAGEALLGTTPATQQQTRAAGAAGPQAPAGPLQLQVPAELQGLV